MTYRFPRETRLTRRSEFQKVFESGRRLRGGMLEVVVAGKPNGLGTPRLGISVSAKVGNAVVRNRLRRLVRESYRLARPGMKKAFDIVIVIRSGQKATGRAAVETEMRELLGRAGIF